MRKSIFAIVLVSFVFVLCISMKERVRVPPGPFDWQKMDIGNDRPRDSFSSKAYDSPGSMRRMFDLETGDECYFLHGEDWTWRDSKDPAIQLVPVFCPRKGGGWAMPPAQR